MAYTIKKWNLDELFPGFDSPELQAAFDNVEEQVASFEGVRGKLNPEMVTPFSMWCALLNQPRAL